MIEAQVKKDREAAEFAAKEQSRISYINGKIQAIADLYATPSMTPSDIEGLIKKAEYIYIGYDFMELTPKATAIYQRAIISLTVILNERISIEKKQAEKAEEEKRQKNVAHQKRINNEAVESLRAIRVNEELAIGIIKAIAKGQIANVFIKY